MPFIKNALLLLLIVLPKLILAQTEKTSKPITVSGNVQLTNNGIAPVPVFALGSPAIISTTTVKKGNFYFNPELSFGMDLKPWTILIRSGYNFINTKKLTLGVAGNISLFFREIPRLPNNEQFEVQRYAAGEINGEYRIKENRSIQFLYWHTESLDKVGVIYENFTMATYSMDKLKLSAKYYLNFKPSILYIFDKDTFEGVFVSQTSSFQRTNWKLNLFLQTIFPIKASPKSNFIWNTGVNIPF